MISNLDSTYERAKINDIYIINEYLGNQIAGYYHCTSGKKLVHINSEASEEYLHKLLKIASDDNEFNDKLQVLAFI